MSTAENVAANESDTKTPDNTLKDQGNAHFKAGNYLKAAAVYTQAIKADPSNATLYSNRSAAFLNLVKLSKALADAETTIKLNPTWEKGYFRKGCVLEAMERYDEAVAAFRDALQQNPQSTEVATKIKRLSLLARDKKRAQEKQAIRSNVNMAKTLENLKSELVQKFGSEASGEEIFTFITDIIEAEVKQWHANGQVDARVTYLFDKAKDRSDDAAMIVNVEKAFESPDTLTSCVSFLRQHAVDTSSKAACLVVPKKVISFPQVWKGQGIRKWKHGQGDGFFVQLESSKVRKLWFVPSSIEKGQTLCRDPEALDLDAHAVLPPLFR